MQNLVDEFYLAFGRVELDSFPFFLRYKSANL